MKPCFAKRTIARIHVGGDEGSCWFFGAPVPLVRKGCATLRNLVKALESVQIAGYVWARIKLRQFAQPCGNYVCKALAAPQAKEKAERLRTFAHPCRNDLITFWRRQKEKAVRICTTLTKWKQTNFPLVKRKKRLKGCANLRTLVNVDEVRYQVSLSSALPSAKGAQICVPLCAIHRQVYYPR